MEKHWKLLIAILPLVVLILLVPLVVFAIRATSETCLKGFELKNKSQLLQEKLKQSQEHTLELETQWRSCINVSRDLEKHLEELTSQRSLILRENQDLAEKLRNAEAALQMEREKKNQNKTNSAFPGPQIYSEILGLGLAIKWLL